MYGVRLDGDWSFFVGKQLTQVCIGPYDVQLHFEDNVSISIQGGDPREKCFCHTTACSSSSAVKGMPGKAVSLVSLLGASVLKVTAENTTTLALFFSNMEELRIYEIDDGYESFTVDGGPNGLITV